MNEKIIFVSPLYFGMFDFNAPIRIDPLKEHSAATLTTQQHARQTTEGCRLSPLYKPWPRPLQVKGGG